MGVLEMNFGADTKGMLGFFRGTSPFYPDFDRLLRQEVSRRFVNSDVMVSNK
jgi:hypothetical protein